MTTNERIEKLEKELAELKAELKADLKPTKRWRPKMAEYYFYVLDSEKVYKIQYENDTIDNFRYAQRNCFKTREEAENYLKYLTIQARIRDIADELNGDQVIDWSNASQYKIYLFYKTTVDEIDYDYNYRVLQNDIYCLSESFLDVCLDRIGFDDLKFYFMYEV